MVAMFLYVHGEPAIVGDHVECVDGIVSVPGPVRYITDGYVSFDEDDPNNGWYPYHFRLLSRGDLEKTLASNTDDAVRFRWLMKHLESKNHIQSDNGFGWSVKTTMIFTTETDQFDLRDAIDSAMKREGFNQ